MSEETIGLNFSQKGEEEVESALKRLMISIAGTSDKLKLLEKSVYDNTRQSTQFSQMLVSHPIQSLKEFTASTEKASIAAEYFRGQLEFIAASRFGTIVLWSAAIGSFVSALRAGMEAANDLDKAVRNVESAFLQSERGLKEYREIQDKVTTEAIQFGESYQNVSKIMWELKSSGLQAGDAFALIPTSLKLVKAGVSDIEQSTRLMAAMYRVFGDSIKDANTSQEKAAIIGDELAYVLMKSQAKMDGLVQGYKTVIATGDLASFSFEQISAYLSVLNNRMLFGSTAGMSLTNAFVQLSKNADKIAAQFGLTIDKTKTLGAQFDNLLTQLHTKFGSANLNVEQLGNLFESLNIRGGRALAALLKGYDELQGTLSALKTRGADVNGQLDNIAEKQMEPLIVQWDRFKKLTETMAAGSLQQVRDDLKDILKLTVDFAEVSKRLSADMNKKGIGQVSGDQFQKLSQGLQNLKTQADNLGLDKGPLGFLFGGAFKILGDPLALFKKSVDDALTATRNLGEEGKSASAKIDVAQKTLAKSFADILNPEEKERLLLLETNQTLEEKILRVAKNLDLAKQQAITEFNIGAGSEKANQEKEKALKFQEELNHLVDQQITANGKETEFLLQMEEKLNRIKVIPLSQEIEKANKALQDSNALLKAAGQEPERVKKALGEVVTAAVAVENSYAKIEAQVNKVVNAMDKTASQSKKLAEILVKDNQPRQAEELLKTDLDRAKAVAGIAQTDDQREKALNAQLSILQTMSELKLGAYGGRVGDQILDVTKQINDLSLKDFDKNLKEFQDASAAAVKSSADVDLVKQAFENFPTSIERAADAIRGGMNSGLQDTQKELAAVSSQLDEISTKIANMPKLDIGRKGSSLDDLETQYNDAVKRQPY